MKPIAFRIFDFCSVIDSGICTLSGDNITVLAGQNEAGKTAVLTALRDFDLKEGAKPETPEFFPEGRFNANPRVLVKFQVSQEELDEILAEIEKEIPEEVKQTLNEKGFLWIEKNLLKASYYLDNELKKQWPEENELSASSTSEDEKEPDDEIEDDEEKSDTYDLFSPDEFATTLRAYWPTFVYFDSFQDSLPRQVTVDEILTSGISTGGDSAKSSRIEVIDEAPQPVRDFITLSEMNLNKFTELSDQDKALGNYLQSCAATITGDFLSYWKQTVDGEQSVDLQIKHLRDEQGISKLAFYIHDDVDLYPDQRSKGFLWFLSFYLRLAAEQKRHFDNDYLLLVDEPGSYLHARAQQDVLHLFEDRIAKSQQIIYSTHSPFLIPPESLHRLRIVINKGDEGTLVLDRLTHPSLQGDEFSDTLSPILTSIGLDIREAIKFVRDYNILVEGMSDFLYLNCWASNIQPNFLQKVNIFPGSGATTLPTLASLFIGWGLPFVVLLDRDANGNKVKNRLLQKLSINERKIIQPKDAITIEDIFSVEDFRKILQVLDSTLTLEQGEIPSKSIKRQKVDKILLARTFAEELNKKSLSLTKKTNESIKRLLDNLISEVNSG